MAHRWTQLSVEFLIFLPQQSLSSPDHRRRIQFVAHRTVLCLVLSHTRARGMETDEQVVLEELYDENYEPTEAGEPDDAGGNSAGAGGGDPEHLL